MPETDNRKLFEYVHNELPAKEMAEVEELITRDPEALKIVNEYLFLKQNLKDLPLENIQTDHEKTKDESNILGQLVASAGTFIAWQLRPNLAFVAFSCILAAGVFQFTNINQNNKVMESVMFNPAFMSQLSKHIEEVKVLGEQSYSTSGLEYSLSILREESLTSDEFEWRDYQPLKKLVKKNKDYSFEERNTEAPAEEVAKVEDEKPAAAEAPCDIIKLKENDKITFFSACKDVEDGTLEITIRTKK